jgi:hypothetical protein
MYLNTRKHTKQLDPYGRLYNRRIQWKARNVIRDSMDSMEEKAVEMDEQKVCVCVCVFMCV